MQEYLPEWCLSGRRMQYMLPVLLSYHEVRRNPVCG